MNSALCCLWGSVIAMSMERSWLTAIVHESLSLSAYILPPSADLLTNNKVSLVPWRVDVLFWLLRADNVAGSYIVYTVTLDQESCDESAINARLRSYELRVQPPVCVLMTSDSPHLNWSYVIIIPHLYYFRRKLNATLQRTTCISIVLGWRAHGIL